MTKTKNWAIALIFVTTALTSCAQILYKFGANNPLWSFYFFGFIFAGLVAYGLAFGFMLLAFRGGEVTVLYPIFASSYVWVVLLSNYFFNEIITGAKIVGVFIIIFGIILISIGSKKGAVLEAVEAV